MPRFFIYTLVILLFGLVGWMAYLVNPPKKKPVIPKFDPDKYARYQKSKGRELEDSLRDGQQRMHKVDMIRAKLKRDGKLKPSTRILLSDELDDNSGWYKRRKQGAAGIDKAVKERQDQTLR